MGVAFDGSPEAGVALRAAEALATAFGARLRLLAAVSPPTSGVAAAAALEGGYGASASYSYSDLEESARERLRARLDRAIEATPSELEAEASLMSGDPAEEIAKAAGDGIDLLVTGSRGYGPLQRVLLGGVSTKLIRSAPCPILVVPRGVHAEDPAETAAREGVGLIGDSNGHARAEPTWQRRRRGHPALARAPSSEQLGDAPDARTRPTKPASCSWIQAK